MINNPLDSDVKRTVDGTLIGVTTKYFNAANVDTNGIDIEINYSFDTDLGLLNIGMRGTHILKYEIPDASGRSKDVVGLFNHDNFARSLPETKIILNADFINNQHTFSLLGRYTSDYKTTRLLSSSAKELGYDQNIDEWLSIDSRYSYSFEFNENEMQLSLGIKNIFDEPTLKLFL